MHLLTVAEVRKSIETYQPSCALRRQTEAVHSWRHHYEVFLLLAAETIEEGWPFQAYPPRWTERTRAALQQFQATLEQDFACHFPEQASSNLRRLSRALELAAADPKALSGRQVGLVRQMLIDSQTRWGAFATEERQQALARKERGSGEQLEAARGWLLKRLSQFPDQGGIADLDEFLAPFPGGSSLPAPLLERVKKAWSTSAKQLVAEKVIVSAKALAKVMPIWGQQAVDAESSLRLLREMVELFWSAFPQAETPIEALLEWDRLAKLAGLGFRASEPSPQRASQAHLKSSQTTASEAHGTLYEKYYAIPTQALMAPTLGTEELWSLCRSRVVDRGAGEPLRGQIAEELRIMTGCGMWDLWRELQPQIDALACAKACFKMITVEEQRKTSRKYQRWQKHRRIAHVWQRLVFFLSVGSQPVELFVEEHKTTGTHRPAVESLLDSLLSPPPVSKTLTGWCYSGLTDH